MGRLTRDPNVRYTQQNSSQESMCVARYTLAVDRRGARDGQQSADFISCVAFGKNGEFAEKYFKQGTKIAITGRIQTGSYTNRDGQKIYTTDVVIEEQEFAEEFERRLSTRFRIEKLHYHVQRADKRNWAYINFLQVGNNIVLPAINTEEDEQAMEQIKTYYPSCTIYQLDSEEIIKQGGALNCITWNIKN